MTSLKISFIKPRTLKERLWKGLTGFVAITTVFNLSLGWVLLTPQVAQADQYGNHTYRLYGGQKDGDYVVGNICSQGEKPECYNECDQVPFRVTITNLQPGNYSIIVAHDYTDKDGHIGYINFVNPASLNGSATDVNFGLPTLDPAPNPTNTSMYHYPLNFNVTTAGNVQLDWFASLGDGAADWTGAQLQVRLEEGVLINTIDRENVGDHTVPISVAEGGCEEGQCELWISKDAEIVDATITYTINYGNTGTADCTGTGVKIYDYLPPEVSYVETTTEINTFDEQCSTSNTPGITALGYNSSEHEIAWNANCVSPGEEGTIEFTAEVDSEEMECGENEITNKANIWSTQTGWLPGELEYVTATVSYDRECTFCGDDIMQTPNEEGTGGPLNDGYEDCDGEDGDFGPYQYCTEQCTIETEPYCGDGIVNPTEEQCDDNNNTDGDGCSAQCTIELGSIQGKKFNDLDANGQQDGSDYFMNDWGVRLYDNRWSQVGTDHTTGETGILGQYRFEDLDMGTYYVCEVQQVGWTQTRPSSIANQSSATDEAPYCFKVIIDEPGQEVTGKQFGNHQDAANLTLVKIVENNDIGTAVATDWTLRADGPTPIEGAGYVSDSVSAGTYTLSEFGGPSGYVASDWTCTGGTLNSDQLTLAVGESAICQITNSKLPSAKIIASKIVCDRESDLPDWGRTSPAGPDITATTAADYVAASNGKCRLVPDWNFQWVFDPTTKPDNNSGAAANWNTFGPTDATGQAMTEIDNFTGNPRIWLREVWNSDYIPFSGTLNTAATQISAEFYCHQDVLNYDNYEWINQIKYDTSYYCVGFNVLNEAKLTVIKEVNNDHGGNLGAADFSLYVNGDPVASGTENTLLPGDYTVSEDPVAGYDLQSIGGDCDASGQVNLLPGDNKTCIITNTRDTGKVYVHKQIDTDGDGIYDVTDDMAATDTYGFYWSLDDGPTNRAMGDSETVTTIDTHTIDENVVPGYHYTGYFIGEGSCGRALYEPRLFELQSVPFLFNQILPVSLTVNKDAETRVTLCNARDTATITVIKNVINDDGGQKVASEFTMSINDVSVVNDTASFPGDELGTTRTVLTGDYNITETELIGYAATYSADCAGTIAGGESKTCTITNDDITSEIDVVKNGPASVTAGEQIDYTIDWAVSEPGFAQAAVLTDTLPDNATFVAADCGTTTGTCVIDSSVPGIVTWTLGDRVAPDSGTVNLTVQTSSPERDGTIVHNEVVFNTSKLTVEDEYDTVIDSAPILTVVKTNSVVGFTNPGKTVTYTVVVSNAADATDTAYNVVMSDILPTGFTFVSGGAATKSWNLGDLAPGESSDPVVYEVNIGASQAAGVYTNTASALADNHGQVSDVSDVEVRVPKSLGDEPEIDLSIVKSVDPTVSNPGKIVTYTLTVNNNGDEDATNVAVTDTLPAGFTFVEGGQAVKTFDLGTLEANHTRVINYEVRVGSAVTAGFYQNTAVLTADGADPLVAQAELEVRVPRVLGLATTGVSFRDYLIFSVGLIALYWAGRTIRRYRAADGINA